MIKKLRGSHLWDGPADICLAAWRTAGDKFGTNWWRILILDSAIWKLFLKTVWRT